MSLSRRGSARTRWNGCRRGIALTTVGLALLVTTTSGAASSPFPEGVRVAYHAETGKVRFVGADLDRPIQRPGAVASDAPPEAAARAFLAAYGSLFGLQDQAGELRVMRLRTADRGRSVVRFQQVHQGVPVLGGELNVHLDRARNILAATGEVLPDLTLDVAPSVTPAAARQKAIAVVAKAHKLAPARLVATAPERWVYDSRLLGGPPGLLGAALVWRTEVTTAGLSDIRELVLVDARFGAVVLHFNQVHTAKNRLTYTGNNTTALPGTLVCSEGSAFPACAGGDTHVEGAHRHAGDTYDFYFSRHGRDSFDNAGGALISTVHHRVDYDNAFWNGTQMVYGDARTYPQSDDVVGHELTHGVTDNESSLFYYYQSGAINESLSDVWGEFVDLTNGTGNDTAGVRWLLGEDISPGGAIRNMQNPPAFSDPDRMTSAFYHGAESDNGGVHINSGVNNKAATLTVDGGTFNGKTVTALGIDKTATIYYEANTNLLTTASDYQDLYDLLQQACTNKIGTVGITAADCQEVKDAADAVEMSVPPPAAPTVDAPICPPGQSPNNLFFDNLENTSSGNWASSALVGTNNWFYPQNPNTVGLDATYATSGQFNLWGYDTFAIADYAIARTASTVLPAGTSYLHFNHAYGFENDGSTFYDGGVVEYSTNGGASWNDAGGLFTHGGYRGPIQTAIPAGNPLAGRQAFAGQSNGYGSSRLDLTSLAGQSVRFRFRIGTDESVDDFGWFIDDVRIYTCSATSPPVSDFDGDGDTDVAVWRPSNGFWYAFGGLTQQWGAPSDVPVPGNYDGDGDTDVAVWRPSNGFWYVLGGLTQQWGAPSDVPVPGNYDGDGDTDVAVWRPSNGFWYVFGGATQQWGAPSDVPVPGDYDGDGDTEMAVWRPSNGFWYVLGGATQQWGAPSDIPVPGDYDGDGDTDVAVWRPSNGFWYVFGGATQQWGAPTDVPVPGDYDGDGDTEIAVWRPSNGFWYVFGGLTQQWGAPSDLPVVAPPWYHVLY